MSLKNSQDSDVELSPEAIESIKRGQQLIVLQATPEWIAVAEIFEGLSRGWKNEMLRLDMASGVEKMALDRVRIVSQINGLEAIFRVISEDIEQANLYEAEKSTRSKASQKQSTNGRGKHYNPYRETNN